MNASGGHINVSHIVGVSMNQFLLESYAPKVLTAYVKSVVFKKLLHTKGVGPVHEPILSRFYLSRSK